MRCVLLCLVAAGCYGMGLRADSDNVQWRRLKKTEAVAKAILKVFVPKPPAVERNEHGDPVREREPVVIDVRGMSIENIQALLVGAANAFSVIKHNTERALAWAKADVIGSGTVEPENQLALDSDEEHTRNAQHLANESHRAYNLAWWREAVKVYRGAMRFYESARFWIKWGGFALAIGFAGAAFIEWRGKAFQRRRARGGERAINKLKQQGADVAAATTGEHDLKVGWEKDRVYRAKNGG